MTKAELLTLLGDWIDQRPRLEWVNYVDSKSYRAEYRSIRADKRDADVLLRAVALRESLEVEAIQDALDHAYSGRLQLKSDGDGRPYLDYCTGQYWPTEYRKAACAVLAQALWYHVRADIPNEGKGKKSAGDIIREYFKGEFGSRMQRRWFD